MKVLSNTASLVKAGSNYTIKKTVIPIGAWNMDIDDTKQVDCNIPIDKILTIQAIIYIDSLDYALSLNSPLNDSDPNPRGGIRYVNNNKILLMRKSGGWFDNSYYDDTTINRGYVIIEHLY